MGNLYQTMEDDLFREELIQAITIVATTTNMTVAECIKQALEILKEEDEKYEIYRQNSNSYRE